MPTAGQNCGNCYFMKPQVHLDNNGNNNAVPCCRADTPDPGDANDFGVAKWKPVDPVDGWCGSYSATAPLVLTTTQGPQGAPGVNAPAWSTGSTSPSGGNNGDWYLQVIEGNGAIWQKQSGSWVTILTGIP